MIEGNTDFKIRALSKTIEAHIQNTNLIVKEIEAHVQHTMLAVQVESTANSSQRQQDADRLAGMNNKLRKSKSY